MSARQRLGLCVAVLLAAVGCAHAQVGQAMVPTLLTCRVSDALSVHLSLDSAGTPLGGGFDASSGTHECSVQTQGPPTAADGAWRFAWTDAVEGSSYRATVRRAGAEGYSLALAPARCGTLALRRRPRSLPGRQAANRGSTGDGAFVLFWRQLRDAVAKRDGEQLQRLSLPQLLFSEGPDMMKAPASVMRRGAACLADVPTGDVRSDLGRLLQATDTPRLDMPPLSRRGDARVSVGDAMTALWTAQGWRLEYVNADRASFTRCGSG